MSVRRVFYGWWIVSATFLVMAVHAGTYYSFGVFFKPIQTELEWTRSDVSWAIFLVQIIHPATYILVGTLIDRIGPRKVILPFAVLLFAGYALLGRTSALWELYLFYGIMVGMGYGVGSAPLFSIVARWFHKRKGLALGLASGGVGAGTIVMPPLTSYLISLLGWRTSSFVIGLILLVVFLAAAFVLVRNPQAKGLTPYGQDEVAVPQEAPASNSGRSNEETGTNLSEALRSRQLWLIIAVMGAFFFGEQMVMFHVVNYATDIGISTGLAAGILSFVGIGSLAGRMVIGGLSDIIGIKRLLLACFIGMTLLLFCLILIRSMLLFAVFGLVFGLLYGGVVPLQAALVSRLFGTKAMGAILGVVVFGTLLAAAMGPLFAGYIFDAAQSYYYAFSAGAVLTGAAALLGLFLKCPEA